MDLYFESYHRDIPNWAGIKPFHEEWADRYAEQAALLWMRCGLDAAVSDFVTHQGHSFVNYPQPIHDAAARLEERVKSARAEINAFADQVDPLCAIGIAA
jgi:uncharacterized protein (DUF2164 family)